MGVVASLLGPSSPEGLWLGWLSTALMHPLQVTLPVYVHQCDAIRHRHVEYLSRMRPTRQVLQDPRLQGVPWFEVFCCTCEMTDTLKLCIPTHKTAESSQCSMSPLLHVCVLGGKASSHWQGYVPLQLLFVLQADVAHAMHM